MKIWEPKPPGTLWNTPGLLRDSTLDVPISQIYFVMKLCMFRTVRLSIIRILFTVHSAMIYVIQPFEQDQNGTAVPSWSCSKAVYKPVWHIPLLSVQWINCWWWTEELSETCRVSWQNKFVKLVHLVGFITKKFVTMHGHMSRCTVTCHDARSHERKIRWRICLISHKGTKLRTATRNKKMYR